MDGIASSQGISKKTLYRFFPNRNALISAALEDVFAEVAGRVALIAQDSDRSFLERMRDVFRVVSHQVAELGDTLVKDLYYHEPQIWDQIDRFRREHVFGIVTKLFEEGMRTGLIRDDIDSRLVPVLFINAMSAILNPAQLVKLPFAPVEVFDTLVRVLFGGILTEEARSQLFAQEETP